MRKITLRRKLWLDHSTLNGSRRKIHEKQRLKFNHTAQKHSNHFFYKKKVSLYSQGRLEFAIVDCDPRPVPEKLSLTYNWVATVEFLTEVRKGLSKILITSPINSRKRNRYLRRSSPLKMNSYWDFTTIREMSIPIALMLASEYDRIRQVNGWVPRAVNIHKWDKDIRIMLNSIGFLELTGIKQKTSTVADLTNGKLLKLCGGKNANGEKIMEYILELGIDLTEEDPRLSDAIMEALTNTVHHAYAHDHLCAPNTVKAWWLVAWLQHKSDGRHLTIATYDQGASIPGTLHLWEKYPIWERKFLQFFQFMNRGDTPSDLSDQRYDGKAIELAIEIGTSSTELGNRGKGLDQIARALELCKDGTLSIYSRCGAYIKKKDTVASSVNQSVPIVGTLVVWQLLI